MSEMNKRVTRPYTYYVAVYPGDREFEQGLNWAQSQGFVMDTWQAHVKNASNTNTNQIEYTAVYKKPKMKGEK